MSRRQATSAPWTLEDERAYDYTKLAGNNIYFLSGTQIPELEEVTVVTADVEEWLAACEAVLVQEQYERKVRREVKKFEKAFKAELDKKLAEQQTPKGG